MLTPGYGQSTKSFAVKIMCMRRNHNIAAVCSTDQTKNSFVQTYHRLFTCSRNKCARDGRHRRHPNLRDPPRCCCYLPSMGPPRNQRKTKNTIWGFIDLEVAFLIRVISSLKTRALGCLCVCLCRGQGITHVQHGEQTERHFTGRCHC